jgi:hypothetical protein
MTLELRATFALGKDNLTPRLFVMRGTYAGFVRLSCLVGNAASQSEGLDGCDLNKFRKPWEVYLNCFKAYQNNLAVDISTEFVSFIKEKHPSDLRKQVEALDMKLGARLSSMARSLPPTKKMRLSKLLKEFHS